MAWGEAGRIASAVATLGILAFIFGVVAENKKPAHGTPVQGKGVVICNYPADPTIQLGSWSIICFFFSCVSGVISVFFPYKGKTIPGHALWRSTMLIVFFTISTGIDRRSATNMLPLRRGNKDALGRRQRSGFVIRDDNGGAGVAAQEKTTPTTSLEIAKDGDSKSPMLVGLRESISGLKTL